MPYNIVFYFTDQQRWDTCGCFGQPLNITPNLDKLAAECSEAAYADCSTPSSVKPARGLL